jgi:DNA processing protein
MTNETVSRIMDNLAKRECLFHSLLILRKVLGIATPSADKQTHNALNSYLSFENIYNNNPGVMSFDEELEMLSMNVLTEINACDFKITRCIDDDFPVELRKFPQCTPVLYYQGNLGLTDTKTIAVIGTRELSEEKHKREGRKVLERLLKNEYTIVSGLALGSDTLGHEYALQNKGKTIAVLGTPINKHYPKENSKLQDEIAKSQLLVSQYPIGVRSFGSFFAHRNKTTIALACEGSVIIRSGDKSGTIHGIKETVIQGKKLYVLDNNYESSLGATWVNTYSSSIIRVREK